MRFTKAIIGLWSLAPLVGSASAAWAEGTAELGVTQALRRTTVLYMDVLDAQTERIQWTGTGSLQVTSPSGQGVATLSSGQDVGLQSHGNGVYRLEPTSDQVPFNAWGATLLNATDNGGRLFSYDWKFNAQSFASSRATNASFYALLPGGLPGTTAVVELKLAGLAGYIYDINANRVGVDGDQGGQSVPQTDNDVTPEFPIYLNVPSIATFDPVVPTVGGLSYSGDTTGGQGGEAGATDCSLVVSGGADGGYFQFTTDVVGSYHLLCDLDGDGSLDGTSGTDLLLVGTTNSGVNSVPWNGLLNGNIVANGAYQCEVRVNVGEFHYVGRDIETSFEGMRMYEVQASGTRRPLTMYWNDSLVQQNAQSMPNGQVGIESSGANGLDPGAYETPAVANSNARAWGNFNSGGKGNRAFLDTYVWLQSTTSDRIDITVVDPNADTDGDGLTDYEERCSIGCDPTNPDTDGDGRSDSLQYRPNKVESSSGNDGGLESNGRLAALLARRAIRRSVRGAGAGIQSAFSAVTSTVALADLIPPHGPGGSTPFISTPEDLTGVTTAVEVLGIDYRDETGRRVASALILETEGELYDHSKAECDRAGGSELTHIRPVRINGGLAYVGQYRNEIEGTRENALTFRLYELDPEPAPPGGDPADPPPDGEEDPVDTVESPLYGATSHWVRREYPDPASDQNVINVQIWAVQDGGALALAKDFLANLEARRGPVQWTTADISQAPNAYYRRALLRGSRIQADITPRGTIDPAELSAVAYYLTPEGTIATEAVGLSSSGTEVSIDHQLPDALDTTVDLLHRGKLIDTVWISDGAWTPYDDSLFGGASQVRDFTRFDCSHTPAADVSRLLGEGAMGEDTLMMSGCGKASGTVGEFLGVARYISTGSLWVDLDAYQTLVVQHRNNTPVRTCLSAAATDMWCVTLDAAPEATWSKIPLSEFSSEVLRQIRFVSFVSNEAGADVEMDIGGLTFTAVPAEDILDALPTTPTEPTPPGPSPETPSPQTPTDGGGSNASGCSATSQGATSAAPWVIGAVVFGLLRRRRQRR